VKFGDVLRWYGTPDDPPDNTRLMYIGADPMGTVHSQMICLAADVETFWATGLMSAANESSLEVVDSVATITPKPSRRTR
jgi:hypothetical protein